MLRSIYMDSDRAAQFVAAIEEHKLGMFSPPAVDEWGTYASKLAALDTLGRSSESRKLGKIVLENARELNIAWKAEDWTYWGALLKTNDARRYALLLFQHDYSFHSLPYLFWSNFRSDWFLQKL